MDRVKGPLIAAGTAASQWNGGVCVWRRGLLTQQSSIAQMQKIPGSILS